MDTDRLTDADFWLGLVTSIHNAAFSVSQPIAVGTAALVGAIYGFLAGLGRGFRRGSGALSDARDLSRTSAIVSGAAALFYVWVLADPSRPITSDPALELHRQLIDWLAREYSILGLMFAIPVSFIIGVVFLLLFGLCLASLVIAPLGAARLLPDVIALFALSAAATVRGLAYVLVRHPATRIVLPALDRDHASIDAKALSRVLAPSERSLSRPPPRFVSERRRRDAEALQMKLLADAELAHAVIERERARAAVRDAKQRARELRFRFWRWS